LEVYGTEVPSPEGAFLFLCMGYFASHSPLFGGWTLVQLVSLKFEVWSKVYGTEVPSPEGKGFTLSFPSSSMGMPTAIKKNNKLR